MSEKRIFQMHPGTELKPFRLKRAKKFFRLFNNPESILISKPPSCPSVCLVFTCGGEDQREQGVMTCGGQNQEDPSILSALNCQDATGRKTDFTEITLNVPTASVQVPPVRIHVIY